MVPLSLRLRNFMSYGLEGGELDLRPIHLACLSGRNGHGKSTLVDAMTWALWGRSRAAREDDLLRQGTTEMEVEFEFATGGALYRVIRKRVQRKSSSQALLELAVQDNGVFRAITGATIAETERAIYELLHLSYETFINSSLLLQGKDDLFTVKRPAERKEVLAEILGLQRYEELAERARERERGFRTQAEGMASRIQDLDRLIGDLPLVEERRLGVESELAGVARQREVSEVQVAELAAQVRGLDGARESLERMQARLAQLDEIEAEQRALRERARAKVARADGLLAEEPAIRASLAALAEARQRNDQLGQLLAQVRGLERREGEVRGLIGAERARLETEARQRRVAIAEARAGLDTAQGLKAELARLHAEQSRLHGLQEERERAGASERALLEQAVALQATNKALDGQRKELRKKIESLRAAGALCPVCDAPIDEAKRKRLHDEAMREGLAGKEEMAANEARIAALGRDQLAARRHLGELEGEIGRIQLLCRRSGALEQELSSLEATAGRLPLLLAEEEQTVTLLQAEAYAVGEQQELGRLRLEMAALGYDPQAHQQLQARIRELAPAEGRREALERAHEERRAALAELDGSELRLAALAEERERLLLDRQPLLELTRGLPALRASLDGQQRALSDLRARESGLQQQLGSLQRQIEDGKSWEAERATKVAARTAADAQAWAHHELNAIFGKRGIQAMLIENALPELEADTNEMLSRMTDNSTQVTFVTRREGKGGNAIETLEIKIADNVGTRTYEMFSGGEAFRINFAIRIALSKLLARRAGAELSFLLIDEGFGSQDVEGRDRLVEAINAIADDFQKILIVTHIDELKDRFDVHIEVTKGPSGSEITVSAA